MRTVVFSTAVIAGVVWIGMVPANAAPPSMSGIDVTNIRVGTVKNMALPIPARAALSATSLSVRAAANLVWCVPALINGVEGVSNISQQV
jgi:hypothetical protein